MLVSCRPPLRRSVDSLGYSALCSKSRASRDCIRLLRRFKLKAFKAIIFQRRRGQAVPAKASPGPASPGHFHLRLASVSKCLACPQHIFISLRNLRGISFYTIQAPVKFPRPPCFSLAEPSPTYPMQRSLTKPSLVQHSPSQASSAQPKPAQFTKPSPA